MNAKPRPATTPPEAGRGTLRSYTVGFVLSIVLTLVAYQLVVQKVLSGRALIAVIIGLAVVRLVVQLLFFLHLGKESKPRWNLLAFLFMVMVLLIVVGGSLWIMQNLNYHTMSPEETNSYILHDEGVTK